MSRPNTIGLHEPRTILEIEKNINLTTIDDIDDIFFNEKKTKDRRVRKYIYDLLLKAKENLPKNYHFVVYEAYRPLSVQIEKWKKVQEKLSRENPHMDTTSEEFISMCNVFIANPYRQGSGHQSGAAIDVSLRDDNGIEYDMGCNIGDFDKRTSTNSEDISDVAKKNRKILKNALEEAGFVNYPAEWWHYSFGDRLWAKLTGSAVAIFGKLDI